MPNLEMMYGRQLLRSDLQRYHCEALISQLQTRPAVIAQCCQRCGYDLHQYYLPNHDNYCPHCIMLGRITSSQQLYYLSEPNHFKKQTNYLQWSGTLTTQQAAVSQQIVTTILQQQTRLLWAVTGAGKTEILFNGITTALQQGKRVCIASPRVDVCLELYPRLQQAFNVDLCLLHGKQPQYQYTQLVLCTVHQLWRFYQAFDVIIVDEVDAFPLVDDAALWFAIQQARKLQSACIYLTATPSPQLQQQINRKQLAVSYLPIRYHRYPLPVPQVKIIPKLSSYLRHHYLPFYWRHYLLNKVNLQRQLLIFVPYVALLKDVQQWWQRYFPQQKITTVYAEDKQRIMKVAQFRHGQCDTLITTTILERGVTFSKIDVLVINADATTFTTTSLVQIAGRVGRFADDQNGQVIFLSSAYTRNIKHACQQIKHMNLLARRLRS